jgi:hypothetical protein
MPDPLNDNPLDLIEAARVIWHQEAHAGLDLRSDLPAERTIAKPACPAGAGDEPVRHHLAVRIEMQRHPLHQPARRRVERRPPMHRKAVVPQHQIADAPVCRMA